MADDVESAGARLTNTFELLEHILLDITPFETKSSGCDPKRNHIIALKTLLRSQQVSRVFRDTIANSPPLRRALFLDPPQSDTRGTYIDENALLAGTWRVSHDIVVDVKTDYTPQRETKKKIFTGEVELTPRYDLCNASEYAVLGSESWRKMYFSNKKYQVRRILLALPDEEKSYSREIPVSPQDKSELKAGEVLESVLKDQMGAVYFKRLEKILRRTKGGPVTAKDLEFVFSECIWDSELESESETEGIELF
ncbi:hypothetical protein HII31_11144 [Pseudocercospora fuligena]|uniref:Uncharacterized protein n=1 Tax=Pseudocercospora fuligena TaxID=685502 RepID=A0A8H6VI24_9PEZI|nr:hypothetical protein HII31_11144 [Pseudocercospora fuligena]